MNIKLVNRIVFSFAIILIGYCNPSVYGQDANRVSLGKVSDSRITEISGIIPYSYQSGYFWVHNDSGDASNIYLIDSLTNVNLVVHLEGVNLIDLEDIAYVHYQGENHLLLADFGDNLRKREVLKLYLIKEPQWRAGTNRLEIPKEDITTISFRYADKKRDAEALFVDPLDNQVYIISKRDFKSQVFSFPLFSETGEVQVLEPLMELPFTFTTAADINRDGTEIVIKNVSNIYYWQRDPKETILTTLQKEFKKLPYTIEPQGEAIAFDRENRYFYTISERPLGLDSYLYKYSY